MCIRDSISTKNRIRTGDGVLEQTPQLTIKGDGRIGFGTISPESLLHLKGNAGLLNLEGSTTSFMQFYPDGHEAGRKGWLGFGNGGNNELYISNEFTDGGLQLRTNNITRMYVNNNGFVGINTTNPAQKLQVIGNARIGISSTEWTEIGHGGAHGFINTQGDGNLEFRHDGNTKMRLESNGKLVIGAVPSTPGDYTLYVEKGILTEYLRAALKSSSRWADDAFGNKPNLEDLEKFIQENSHLIGVPSADELLETGIDMVDMDATLLRQIEWLWEYTIQINKEKDKINKEKEALENKVNELSQRMEKLERLLNK